MMNQPVVSGRMVGPRGGAPKRFSVGRVCAEPDCSTQLTMYNRLDTCFRHSPIRYPRTRNVPSQDGNAMATFAAVDGERR